MISGPISIPAHQKTHTSGCRNFFLPPPPSGIPVFLRADPGVAFKILAKIGKIGKIQGSRNFLYLKIE
jgi:hypothetical protein